ncbi:hypothetical protein [Pseudomonas monteilii]|uniref:hypothetical protein n=1 Tax=Pseudomonas monteilii TaxID=76759 RepID=UPI001E485138|nr:hypothetical protein [Pseudomonas monteilii]WJO34803.1 hypothetical protein LU690_08555 [Pseudomonas monteilii]
MNDTNKMREQFEVWVLENYPGNHMGRFATGEYHGVYTELAWKAWQASREAVTVELPQQSGANRDWNQAIRYCQQAVEAHGLKVQP